MSTWPAIPTSPPRPTPFGSDIKTRGYSAQKYRFGFNGKEEDGETAADAYDFGARIYDARLARWLAIDPHFFSYSWLSAYSALANSPLIIVDPDGTDIVNGHVERVEIQKREVQRYETELERVRKECGINRRAWREYAKSHNRSVASVKKVVKSYERKLKDAKGRLETETRLKDEVEKYIENFRKDNPKMYSLMNTLEFDDGSGCRSVDVVLTFDYMLPNDYKENYEGVVKAGENELPDMNSVKPNEQNGKYIWPITIEADAHHRAIFERMKGEDVIKHEFGHAWYILNHFKEYQEYRRQKSGETDNGHLFDDESGKEATRWGKMKGDYEEI